MARDTGWLTSSYSNAGSENCVQVRITAPVVRVRDSKDPAGVAFAVGPAAWRGFVAGVGAGRFEH